MILFTILLSILIAIAIAALVATAIAGGGLIAIVGDVIVFGFIVWLIFKIFKKKEK